MTDISPLRQNAGRIAFRAEDRARRAIDVAMSAKPEVLRTIFTRFDASRIMSEAKALDGDAGRRTGPLAGILVSIKDLFDEKGQVTSAGSTILADAEPANADAEAVGRLRAAGAIGCGRTTMSEFAYSGVGLNPHFGNPGNIFDSSRISGGSTSGGALSVALGIADVALGSDTGGSVRIPAALNGLCGFKPSQSAVPLDGAFPLSQSYDSIGPLARTIKHCSAVHAVLSATAASPAKRESLRIGVARGILTEGLDTQVAADFQRAIALLSAAGFALTDIELPMLEGFGNVNRIIVASEAHAIHASRLARMQTEGDPHVLRRIRAAESFASTDEVDARAQRAAAIAAFSAQAENYDVFIAPTLPTVAPLIADVEADFDRLNGLMLRNPSAINFLDGCAATVPMHAGQPLATGLMIFAPGGHDWRVLGAAEQIEAILAS
ncbi:amidase family protein [Pelagibacterium halotolerans]|uniref:Asp-tRNAAsn/Glu-tRNAGln amidotransferase A subunit-related amidase n=1 Tax=Pelagibacterium halotolerans (strain DSM 22347 / JCM 15775 / CGMCC 1.7692 / B2) TaxID=1082931 RepID=G4RCB4_PELHB|nr:amidase family protein [Pelagibacterium halotolerans]AEQ53708.1 Asp-tRNAAsn/Glu-tRNAGln amidotransferase A subunit-related amidase [Pelagibacterium halotolerans B2]QJR20129.1 amidase [Pelagibacterium halotolerans]SEA79296.1 aspartyl-tRNA(Asn)/glutamyl-tRNA(Gln) amidotransferase subunit A [Pelagibacterium halotolerans]